jgi:hypothetical protein
MKSIFSKALAFNSIVIAIGVLGGISGVLAVFFTSAELGSTVSAKWLLFVCYVSLVLLLLTAKIAYEFHQRAKKSVWDPREGFRLVRFIEQDGIFVVNKTVEQEYNSLVSLYIAESNYDKFFGFGRVANVQEKLLQIEVIMYTDDFLANGGTIYAGMCANRIDVLRAISVKFFVPYDRMRSYL